MGGGEVNVLGTGETQRKLQKSYFDVLGLCCSSEIPLVENVLKPIDGVKDVSVIIASRTVIVVHDALLVSPAQIVNALNQARLEASVKACHGGDDRKKWPSPYTLASAGLLALSLLSYVYHPLRWLALGAVGAGIFPVARKGFVAVRNLRIDINILVLVAVIGTIAMEDYLEAAAIVFLFSSAEWLEARASHKATVAMSALMSVAPQKAVLAETGEEVGVEDIKLNTLLAVKTGEVIPLDGIVIEGRCEVDEKTLTGESFPVAKHKDSIVLAGTINVNGYISVKTTALAEDCVVTKMAKLVEEAQNKKSSTQRFIDRCARIYTPAILVLAIGIAVIPAAVHVHNLHHWFNLALVVLVSACPCALVLSTPVATFCALTNAAKSGVMIKGGDYLETMAKIKNVAFDKTGTITRGEFSVEEFRSIREDVSKENLLYWVSSIESKSSHPMAASLVGYAKSFSVDPRPQQVEDFLNFPGEGVYGKIDGREVFIGNRRIAERAGCETGMTGATAEGRAIGYVFCGATEVGNFSLSDTCRTGAEEAIKKLKSLGLRTAMLTGDSQAAAMHTQNQLNRAIDEVHAELLPEDKAKFITRLKQNGPVAMVGDGVNDAPALATADIGISMGVAGSALATETGHVILMTNDVRKIPEAIMLARQALRKVVENVILSVTTKTAILALAIARHPYVWAAVLADVGTCLLVILNSMLLLRGGDHQHQHQHHHRKRCCKSSPAQQTGSICSDHKKDTSQDHHKCCSTDKDAKLCASERCPTESSLNNCKSSPHLHSHHRHERKHHDCHSKSKSCSLGKEASEVIENGCPCPHPGTVENFSKKHLSEDAHCDHHDIESGMGEEEEDGSHCGGHHPHAVGESHTHDIESGLDHAPLTSSSGCCKSYVKECCSNHGHGHHLGPPEVTITMN